MRTLSPQSQSPSGHTNIKFEIFIVVFSILPFFVLAYFYPFLPDRVPLFLKLNGEVATWTEKSVMSVFRVPLMAVVTQIVCFLTKVGTLQSAAIGDRTLTIEHAKLHQQYLRLNADLWDWFRWTVAFKMSAESVSTIFLSIERFNFLATPTFIITAFAAVVGIAGALFYSYRMLITRHELKEKFGNEHASKSADARRVYGGFLYFDPFNPALFVSRYAVNFANRWSWVLIACVLAYLFLVFSPAS